MTATLAVASSCGGSDADRSEALAAQARGGIVLLRSGDLFVERLGSGTTSRIARSVTSPSVSADGSTDRAVAVCRRQLISFAAENIALGPGTGRYVAAADGTNAHRVGAGGSAAWSPDGHWLAFADESTVGGSDVWIVRRDGSGRRRITKTATDEVVIAWVAATP